MTAQKMLLTSEAALSPLYVLNNLRESRTHDFGWPVNFQKPIYLCLHPRITGVMDTQHYVLQCGGSQLRSSCFHWKASLKNLFRLFMAISKIRHSSIQSAPQVGHFKPHRIISVMLWIPDLALAVRTCRNYFLAMGFSFFFYTSSINILQWTTAVLKIWESINYLQQLLNWE